MTIDRPITRSIPSTGTMSGDSDRMMALQEKSGDHHGC